jgi:hypothetical protein
MSVGVYQVERTFDKLGIETDASSGAVTFHFIPTKEIVFIKDSVDIPPNCKILKSEEREDASGCVTEPLGRTCLSLFELEVDQNEIAYRCCVTVKHVMLVNNKEHTSDVDEIRYFEATFDDLLRCTRKELETLRSLTQIPEIPSGSLKSSLYTCLHPATVKHPGSVSSIPVWSSIDDEEKPGKEEAPKKQPLLLEPPKTQRPRPTQQGQQNQQNQETHVIEIPLEKEPLTYKQTTALIGRSYNFEESLHSLTLDIIGVYLKGQKLLYIEAKVYCEQHLYALMLPAIMITALCSVISISLKDYPWGGILVSSFTAINSFILSLVTYLKLDAKAEAHKMTSYSFEKLQSECEFNSGRILFADPKVKLLEAIDSIATQVKDLKEKNQFILPEAVRHRYPILFSTNVFAEVKRIQNEEILHINTMKNLINAATELKKSVDATQSEADRILFEQNADQQTVIFEILVKYRLKYAEIDEKFTKEINENIKRAARDHCNCCMWLKS